VGCKQTIEDERLEGRTNKLKTDVTEVLY